DEGCHHERIGGAQRQQHGEDAEKHHLDDEHLFSAITIGQPPSVVAPMRMPNNEAAATTPFSVAPRANSSAISGKATPVVKTKMASKNLPAAASHQMNHCILVMGAWPTGVASAQSGVSSM